MVSLTFGSYKETACLLLVEGANLRGFGAWWVNIFADIVHHQSAGGGGYDGLAGRSLGGLFSCELALLGDEAVEPCEALVAFYGAFGVDVPVEGFAVVTEAAV